MPVEVANTYIPAAESVNIGCSMNGARMSLQAHPLPDNRKALRDAIEVNVPVGFGRYRMVNARESACKRIAPGANRLFAKSPELKEKLRPSQQSWGTRLGILGAGLFSHRFAGRDLGR